MGYFTHYLQGSHIKINEKLGGEKNYFEKIVI